MNDISRPASIPQMPIQSSIQPMPPEIAKAIVMAIKAAQGVEKTGEGEDRAEKRKFAFSTIDDVLEAAHEALEKAELAILPMETEHSEEVVELLDTSGRTTKQMWARYGYQFMLIHGSGETWVNARDTRHISLPVTGGQTAGKAQSFALKHYLRGLLRLRTGEADVESEDVDAKIDAPVSTPRRAKKGSILFDFGPNHGGLQAYTPLEVKHQFGVLVAPLSPDKHREWEEANHMGLKELHETAKSTWLAIRKMLDADKPEKTKE